MIKHSEEFQLEVVAIALTGGLASAGCSRLCIRECKASRLKLKRMLWSAGSL